jgi:hypothetical protein
MKKVMIIFFSILFISMVSAAMDPAKPFCEHLGYTYEFNESEGNGVGYCIFNDSNKCEIIAFFNNSCGEEYKAEFPCVKLGKRVWEQFENCCEGKPYLSPGIAGQAKCMILDKNATKRGRSPLEIMKARISKNKEFRLSNGRNARIKIMPDIASERALSRLRLKVCNETRDCTIELKEVGEGNKTRAVYEARARKTFRILGFIKNRQEVRTRIDAETGEEIEVRRPWWAWMATEEEEADEIEETTETEE